MRADVTPKRNSTQKPAFRGELQPELYQVHQRLVVREAARDLVPEGDRDDPHRRRTTTAIRPRRCAGRAPDSRRSPPTANRSKLICWMNSDGQHPQRRRPAVVDDDRQPVEGAADRDAVDGERVVLETAQRLGEQHARRQERVARSASVRAGRAGARAAAARSRRRATCVRPSASRPCCAPARRTSACAAR